ncbi:hypothetical protein FED26_06955 [Acinetobacter baumannii]|nr:hypothetical protein FED26_06955 [Acinetobacter baumannii]
MEREKKKPEQGCSGYKLETTALNYKDNYTAFRIRCIMLILGNIKTNFQTYPTNFELNQYF